MTAMPAPPACTTPQPVPHRTWRGGGCALSAMPAAVPHTDAVCLTRPPLHAMRMFSALKGPRGAAAAELASAAELAPAGSSMSHQLLELCPALSPGRSSRQQAELFPRRPIVNPLSRPYILKPSHKSKAGACPTALPGLVAWEERQGRAASAVRRCPRNATLNPSLSRPYHLDPFHHLNPVQSRKDQQAERRAPCIFAHEVQPQSLPLSSVLCNTVPLSTLYPKTLYLSEAGACLPA